MIKNDKNEYGFTLIELILYIALITLILSALVPFAWNMIESGVKSSVQQEVNANARYISERIKYEVRNATGINSVAATSISLATATPATNPTVIDLSGGNIRIKQGTGAAVNLNSSNTVINSLTFTNLTSGDTKTKNIQFVFTTAASFGVARQEYQDSVVIEGDAEVRSN
jgi:type II secretory pathway pseudopilin PulG